MAEESAYSQKAKAARRPKLLFLAYYFPPLNSSACVRTWNIAKYLSRLGWDVTVVSPHPQQWRKVNNPKQVELDLDREGIRRLSTGHRWRWLSPWDLKCWNTNVGWIIGGIFRNVARRLGINTLIGWGTEVKKACAGLTPGDVDVILASGPPFIGFKLAKELSDRLGCPYVLDYRDAWQDGNGAGRGGRESGSGEQERIVASSSAVTVVSPSLLNGRFDLGAKLRVVTNGFDPEELGSIRAHDFGHFAIVYTGNFYPPQRVITPVMEALHLLRSSEKEPQAPWMFHYFGVHGDHIRKEAETFGLMDRVVLHGKVSRDEALSAVKGAGISVVVSSVLEEKAEKDGGIVTGKLFESLGLGSPVLFIGPSGADVEAIIGVTGLARRCSAKDIVGITGYLKEVMRGKVPCAKRPELYAWKNLIKDLHEVLREAVRTSSLLRRDRQVSDIPSIVHTEDASVDGSLQRQFYL